MYSLSNQIYFQYFSLGDNAYREKVRFVEENPKLLEYLNFEKKIELEVDYLYCLFELGKYERFLSKVDVVIETVIMENIMKIHNENVFYELLFKKSACLYQISKHLECDIILQQLVRMSTSNPLFMGLYIINKRKIFHHNATNIKAISVFALLLSLGLALLEIFLSPFLPISTDTLFITRLGLTCIAALCYIWLEIVFQRSVYKATGMFSSKLYNIVFGRKVDE